MNAGFIHRSIRKQCANMAIHAMEIQIKTYASSRVVKCAHANLQNNPVWVLCGML